MEGTREGKGPHSNAQCRERYCNGPCLAGRRLAPSPEEARCLCGSPRRRAIEDAGAHGVKKHGFLASPSPPIGGGEDRRSTCVPCRVRYLVKWSLTHYKENQLVTSKEKKSVRKCGEKGAKEESITRKKGVACGIHSPPSVYHSLVAQPSSVHRLNDNEPFRKQKTFSPPALRDS